MQFLFKPFYVAVREMKKNKQIKEELSEKGYKVGTFYPFIIMNYQVLIGYPFIYIALVYYLYLGIFPHPMALAAFAVTAVVLGIGTFFHSSFYPDTRKSYLESIGFYNNQGKNRRRRR